jgi:hypothetical protein
LARPGRNLLDLHAFGREKNHLGAARLSRRSSVQDPPQAALVHLRQNYQNIPLDA